MINLYQHQEIGRDFLLEKKKACLFFEIGTGKTFTALAALEKLPGGRVLIAAPKRVLMGVWLTQKEYELPQHQITYLNYEKIARDPTFAKQQYDYIVLDEVHRLKGKTTKTSRRFEVVCKKAKYVFGLTGTPVANNYADVYNIFKHMAIPEFTDMSYNVFVQKYYYTKQMKSARGFAFNLLLAPRRGLLPELIERISRWSIVKRLEDCVDLKGQTTNLIYIDGMVTPKYREIANGILKFPDGRKETMIPLETINKMHQAANGFIYDPDGGVYKFKENPKLKALDEQLQDLLEETDRVIVVYLYQKDLEELKTLKYDWTTNPFDFPNKQIIFVQFAQSEGLNLQYCNQMIFYNYDYSFLNFDQMKGRIYRTGQTKPVTYTIYIARNTIEEKVWKAISTKQSIDEFLKEALRNDT